MPRKARAELESGVYHVFARGNRKQEIYVDDADRLRYLRMLQQVIERMEWLCMSYCLMGNHVHMLIETQTANLGAGMHCLQGKYAQYFNRRHGFVGHLFQDRYDERPQKSDPQLWQTARYIALNPVVAGLCLTPTDYPWSSHAAVVAGRAPDWVAADRLESYFGSQGGEGLQRFIDFVDLPGELNGDSPRLGAL
jgi:REP element-mobilizing transposase RayT